MSEHPSTDLHIRLGPSRQLAFGLSALYVGAIPCALVNDLPMVVQGLVIVSVVIAWLRCMTLHATCRAARAIVLLVWDRRGQWRLIQRDGRMLDAGLERGAYSHPALVALPFSTRDGRRVCVLIVPDRIDVEDLRRLRVRLRCASTNTRKR